jgi:hypothetical protein
MIWGDLINTVTQFATKEPDFIQEGVFVWDASIGEFYPADVLVTDESDGVIDKGRLFISINEDKIK